MHELAGFRRQYPEGIRELKARRAIEVAQEGHAAPAESVVGAMRWLLARLSPMSPVQAEKTTPAVLYEARLNQKPEVRHRRTAGLPTKFITLLSQPMAADTPFQIFQRRPIKCGRAATGFIISTLSMPCPARRRNPHCSCREDNAESGRDFYLAAYRAAYS